MARAPPPPPRHGTVVVRLGALCSSFGTWRDLAAGQLAELQRQGVPVVAVHAGAPRSDELRARLGSQAQGAGAPGPGAPAPAPAALAEMAASAAGKELVGAVQRHGGRALGLGGRDALLLRAAPVEGAMLGHAPAGRVEGVDAQALRSLLDDGFLPVLAAVAAGPRGEPLAVGADDAAAAVAVALAAAHLVVLDRGDGVEARGRRVPALGSGRARLLLAEQALPPAQAAALAACARAVEAGVGAARIVDARRPGSLLAALDPASGEGTRVRAETALEAVRALPR